MSKVPGDALDRLEVRFLSTTETMLDSSSWMAGQVVDHYLRYCFTHDVDLVHIVGDIPASAIEVIAKYSARISVLAAVDGDTSNSGVEFEDHRTDLNSRFMILLSPYQNHLFTIDSLSRIENLSPRLQRTSESELEPFSIFVDGSRTLHLSLGKGRSTAEIAPTVSPFPTMRMFDLYDDGGEIVATPTSEVSILLESLDPHHEEVRAGIANLAKTHDPKGFSAQFQASFEQAKLTGREAFAVQRALDVRWEPEGPGFTSDVLVLPPTIVSLATLRYLAVDHALPSISSEITTAHQQRSGDAAEELEALWFEGSGFLSRLTDVQRRVMRLEDRERPLLQERSVYPVFFARLISYSNDTLERALERQARLLTVINRFTGPQLTLEYRIFTHLNSAGTLAPVVEVYASVSGCSELEAASLQRSFGELVHATFVGLYSLNFAMGENLDSSWSKLYGVGARFRAKIITTDGPESLTSIVTFPDWAFVLDYICSMDRPVSLVMSVSAGGQIERKSAPGAFSGDRSHGGAFQDTDAILERINGRLGLSGQAISLQIEVSSNDPIPSPLLELVCAEAGPDRQFTYEEVDLDAVRPLKVALLDALRLFHPPFGAWYGQSRRESPLHISAPVDEFPALGMPLGKATTRHAKANVEVPVRLPDQDRLRHVYVIGKTGSGKTNLLRGMVSAELANPRAGLAIVDPHGDLAFHVLNILPASRFQDLQVVDLTDPDLTPVINPLLIKTHDRLSRSRLTQDILGILKSRIFHEWSGPRFDEIIRLLLDTMLDEGYPATPSLIELSLLLTDEVVQRHVRKSIVDVDLRARWTFHDRLKGGKEYFDLLDWAVSKLDDLQHDDTLRSILGGERNTVDIDLIARHNGVLVVSIPESVVGKETAEFIGSLVLVQLKSALFRRSLEAQEPFFLYVDEFQKFAGIGFEELLAEARKFGVGLVMAHQNIEQLRSFSSFTGQNSSALINSILGNVGTIAAFSISSQDADTLSRQIGVSAEEISRIDRFDAVLRATVDGHQLPAFSLSTDFAEQGFNPRKLDDIREHLVERGLLARREAVAIQIQERRWRLRPNSNEEQLKPSEGDLQPAPPTSSNFLDTWLEKRRSVKPAGSAPVEPVSTAVKSEVTNSKSEPSHKQSSPAHSANGWSSIVGPVTPLADLAEYLNRSEARLRSDAERGRLMILTTRDGTLVSPANHYRGGSLLAGLVDVLAILRGAPFGEWTQAAWLATPSLALGDMSPLGYLASEPNHDLVLAATRAYAEKLL